MTTYNPIDRLRQKPRDPGDVEPVRSRPIRWLVGCGLLLIATIAVGAAVMIGNFREHTLEDSARELENAALLLARRINSQIQEFEIVRTVFTAHSGVDGLPSRETFRREMSSLDTHLMLRAHGRRSIETVSFKIYDADGMLINSSEGWPVSPASIAGEANFKALERSSGASPYQVELTSTGLSEEPAVSMARKIVGPSGEFLGVAAQELPLARFQEFFSSLMLGKGATVALYHRNGALLARYPELGPVAGDAPLAELLNGGGGVARHVGIYGGEERMVAVHALGQIPLSAVASVSVAAVLDDWRAQTRLLVLLAAASALGIGAVIFLIVWQLKKQFRESKQRLEQEKLRAETALNNMTQGLVLYDASARVVLCNRRYLDMYGLSPEVVKPGCRFVDLVRYRKETGSFKGDVEEYCASVLANVASGKATVSVVKTADGRSIQVVNQPLVDGGWVVTMDDITARQKLEEERDRNYMFLHEIIDHIPSQITVKDARDRRYLLANRVAEAQFGLPREAIVGRTSAELFSKESSDTVLKYDDEALRSDGVLFLDEFRWQSQGLGERFITSRRISIKDQAGEPRYLVNVVEDVTERRRADERIAHLAHYDPLTDLPNRVLFREQIERELGKIGSGGEFALLYIDIDEFKGINDSLGHPIGDELLKEVAACLRRCVRKSDFVARLGGDEFAIIQTGIGNIGDVTDLVERIYKEIRKPHDCQGHRLSTNASIGIALAPRDGTNLDQLIKNADLAMYSAKADGRRTHRFFESEMDARARARRETEHDLSQAISTGGLQLHYQPIVDLGTDEITGCEALLRWQHPVRGMVSPAEFIPIAEETGLICELGEWALKTACTEAAAWPDHVRLAVNVSPIQFRSGTLALTVASALAASGLPARRLELEITEAVLIRDDDLALASLHQLRALGVRVALDDFGTGYSSLSYLQRFPFDKIKIDRCFVSEIAKADGSSSIVQAVVSLAAARNMTTTAEGVETEQQRSVLRELGCTEMQGYLFSAAKPAQAIRQMFDERRTRPTMAGVG